MIFCFSLAWEKTIENVLFVVKNATKHRLRSSNSVVQNSNSAFLHKKQGKRRLHFARAVHSRHPFPPTGDAAYRQHAGGPSHRHRQHAQKFGKDRACGSGDILADKQTDKQTHRQTYSSQYFAIAPAGEVMIAVFDKHSQRKIYNAYQNILITAACRTEYGY